MRGLCDRLEGAIEANDTGALVETLTAMADEGPDLDDPESWDSPETRIWLLASRSYETDGGGSVNDTYLDELRVECAGGISENSVLAADAQTNFCKAMLPLYGVSIDIGVLTGPDPTDDDPDLWLPLIEVTRDVLTEAQIALASIAFNFEAVGNRTMSKAVASIGTATDDIINSTSGGELAAALKKIASAEIPDSYCKDEALSEFSAGYLDAWLGRSEAKRAGRYAEGYSTGLADGWRDDAPGFSPSPR